ESSTRARCSRREMWPRPAIWKSLTSARAPRLASPLDVRGPVMTDPMRAGRVSVALPERLPTLTGMRALAAGTVFLGHVLALYFFADPKAQATASQALFRGK